MHVLPDKIFQIISSYELVGISNLPLMQEYAFNFDWANSIHRWPNICWYGLLFTMGEGHAHIFHKFRVEW